MGSHAECLTVKIRPSILEIWSFKFHITYLSIPLISAFLIALAILHPTVLVIHCYSKIRAPLQLSRQKGGAK